MNIFIIITQPETFIHTWSIFSRYKRRSITHLLLWTYTRSWLDALHTMFPCTLVLNPYNDEPRPCTISITGTTIYRWAECVFVVVVFCMSGKFHWKIACATVIYINHTVNMVIESHHVVSCSLLTTSSTRDKLIEIQRSLHIF